MDGRGWQRPRLEAGVRAIYCQATSHGALEREDVDSPARQPECKGTEGSAGSDDRTPGRLRDRSPGPLGAWPVAAGLRSVAAGWLLGGRQPPTSGGSPSPAIAVAAEGEKWR